MSVDKNKNIKYIINIGQERQPARSKTMTVKASEIKEWAVGNGCPARGDEYEGVFNGKTYRAEFYAERSYNQIIMMLAVDSPLEVKENGQWIPVDTSMMDDNEFNNLIEAITPDVEDDLN